MCTWRRRVRSFHPGSGLMVPSERTFSCRFFEFNVVARRKIPLSRGASRGCARTPEPIDSSNPPSIDPSQACCVAGGLFFDDNFRQMSGSRRPPRLHSPWAPKGDLEIQTLGAAQRAPHAPHHPWSGLPAPQLTCAPTGRARSTCRTRSERLHRWCDRYPRPQGTTRDVLRVRP